MNNPARGTGRLEVTVNARHLAGPRTGTEVYMEQLLQALSRTGEVQITALTWSPLDLGLPRVRELIPARHPRLRPGSIPAVLWKLWFDQWYSLRAALPAYGILYHGMEGFLPYSLRGRDRCAVTVHDLGWQAHPELYHWRLRVMYNGLFPWVLRRADRFIAVSRYTADDLIRRSGVPASKIEVIYHGLDPAFANSDRAGSDSAEEPYVLAVGGVSPRKNSRRLIEAFTRWRARGGNRARYQLRITGTSLDREVAGGNAWLPDGVTLLGYVDKARLARLYAGAAAFLYPGIYEGFGLPIVEAMACGTPVVTSTTGATPEIAGGAAILVDPFEVESIAQGLEQVTQPEEQARLRELGRQRVGAFDWSAAAAATLEVYRGLVRGAGPELCA